jgi:hypothetical protein
MLTAGHGVIVAESFDVGESRTLPWARRPQAAALVVRPGNAANPRAFLRQAARATVRSEKILPNGPWFVLSLTVAGFLAGGLGVVFAAGMAFGWAVGRVVSRLMRSPGVRVSSGCGGRG